MAPKLDKLDLKILTVLDANSRISLAGLARELRVAQETVRYRVNQLEKNKFILHFMSVIDTGHLGYCFYKVLFRLHNASEADVKRFTRSFVEMKQISWVARLYGSFDVGITATMVKPGEMSELVDQVTTQYCSLISDRTFSVNIRGEYLTRSYLGSEKRRTKAALHYHVETDREGIDILDESILRSLALDSRESSTAIAAKLDVSHDMVRSRIRKLEQRKILTRYTIVLNHEAMGQLHYKVLFFLNASSTKEATRFETFCRNVPQIVYIIKALGAWDYELDIEVQSTRDLYRVLLGITEKFSLLVKSYDVLEVTEIYKYNLFP